MSLEQLEQAVLKLPREERRRFAHWFYEHENDILDPQTGDEISPEVLVILEHRLTEIEEHPGAAPALGGNRGTRPRNACMNYAVRTRSS